MSPTAIAQAVWEYSTRTLASGTPVVVTRADEIAQAVWQHSTRTLTSGPLTAANNQTIAYTAWNRRYRQALPRVT